MTFTNWNTFLFLDQESNENCWKHNFKKVMGTSKIGAKVIYRGNLCITCEIDLMEYDCNVIVRKGDKWIPMKDYMKQHEIINLRISNLGMNA